jgi:YesN/AraC family two-component response regulator
MLPLQNQASVSQGRESIRARSGVASLGGKMMKKTHKHSTNGSSGAESVRIWKARNFIHEHAGEELSLRNVAAAANTSPNYLS